MYLKVLKIKLLESKSMRDGQSSDSSLVIPMEGTQRLSFLQKPTTAHPSTLKSLLLVVECEMSPIGSCI